MTEQERVCQALPGAEGTPTYNWVLTTTDKTDDVKLVAKPYILPVIFVPGIMGSNLRTKEQGEPIWRLNSMFGLPLGLLWDMVSMGPGTRQRLFHPDRTEVDPDGDVPNYVAGVGDTLAIRSRGWGEIGETSYRDFLVWLELHLNQMPPNPAKWSDFSQVGGGGVKLNPGVQMGIKGEPFGAEGCAFEPLKSDDLLARARYHMPVHAFGYNWLDSNERAGAALAKRINELIERYNQDPFWCAQVLLITHSMGGLVVRSCLGEPGMTDKIAGVVHGVMPATGAAVAYRRCKVGMGDESWITGLVIGSNGQEVTSIFAQAPGALQLLPSKDYRTKWLQIKQSDQAVVAWPVFDPYSEIYLERNKWWGLINEDWLTPENGNPIVWEDYKKNIGKTKKFHVAIASQYHPQTYVFYGKDEKYAAFEKVTWRVEKWSSFKNSPTPSLSSIAEMDKSEAHQSGTSPVHILERDESVIDSHSIDEPSGDVEIQCELQDSSGDGTVPAISGSAPKAKGSSNIKQQFCMRGFEHEPAYKDESVRNVTLYAIAKICAKAKRP